MTYFDRCAWAHTCSTRPFTGITHAFNHPLALHICIIALWLHRVSTAHVACLAAGNAFIVLCIRSCTDTYTLSPVYVGQVSPASLLAMKRAASAPAAALAPLVRARSSGLFLPAVEDLEQARPVERLQP